MAVSLTKIVLDKKGDSHKIDLTKISDQKITINLNWNAQQNKGLFSSLFGGNKEIDLDLGCYFELKNGMSSVIDGVQFSKGRGGPRDRLTKQGCYTQAPWIWHCGDDRSGANSEGENILVNPKGIPDLKRIIVYCFIYDGVAKWSESDAIVTVEVPNYPPVVVEMGKQTDNRSFCAIASIEFNNNQMSIRKEVTFHAGHRDCDEYYHWGFKWEAGGK
ncbi:stress protein [Gallibacterium anatis]|uniref:Stress protein n=3 Tax=Gallibacterium anatis TaxID=750 RepID=A0A0A3AGB3_9PAST|nr:stress protein [Gallibacterium anatis]AEC16848.1 Tellurium resistance protein [Gallibacterium anatis UMN179]ERF78787.1 stress protein [Gallibacterium anatis 12656/12]KGQ23424.1 stress protein [Gallibacterium anatis]KGQ29025.1 stress protein [Gallibacterium anatis]KGQ29200.1 stress protein [Gallibacterium anatis]